MVEYDKFGGFVGQQSDTAEESAQAGLGNNLENFATGPLADQAMVTVQVAPYFEKDPNLAERISTDSKQYWVTKTDKFQRLEYEGKKSAGYVSMPNPSLLSTMNNLFEMKFIRYVFNKIAREAMRNGKMIHYEVEGKFQDFVDNGSFGDLDNAKRGVVRALTRIRPLSILGYVEKGKYKYEIVKEQGMFRGWDVGKRSGWFTLYLDDGVNWNAIIAYFHAIPKYYTKLKMNAFCLLICITNILPMRKGNISKDGCINISLRTIQKAMCLPMLSGNKNPKRTIVEPILDAINELLEIDDGKCFDLQVMCEGIYHDKQGHIHFNGYVPDFLKGYLRVECKGDLLQFYKNRIATYDRSRKSRAKKAEKREIDIEARKRLLEQKEAAATVQDAPEKTG